MRPSTIPRLNNGLIASCGYSARRRQYAFEGATVILLNGATQFNQVAAAYLTDGGAGGDTFLDRVERSRIIGLALRRHGIFIARQTVFQTDGIEIYAAAARIDVLGAACAQHRCRILKLYRLRRDRP